MTVSRTLNFAAVVLLGAAVHTNSFAQASNMPTQGMQHRMDGHHASRMASHTTDHAAHHSASNREAKHQNHLEALKTSLQIQAAQESAWHAFTSAMTHSKNKKGSNLSENLSSSKPADLNQLTTPERIDKMMLMKTEKHAEMTKRMEATKTFYASLTPVQQKEFDKHSQKFMKRGSIKHHGKMHS
jgi:hypothetical protein